MKFLAPPIGSICGFSIWNIYMYYRYNYFNNKFSNIKYDIVYSFLGYAILPLTGFYFGMNLKRFNLLPDSCLIKK